MSTRLPEIKQLEKLIGQLSDVSRSHALGRVQADGEEFDVHALVLGCEDKTAPTMGLFGGVHGLERVGSHLIISYLESLVELLQWDSDLKRILESSRLVMIPIVNPGGMAMGKRSNPNGVDLMRNAPVDADVDPAILLGGHRYGSWLPWFRGESGQRMEDEAQWLCDFVVSEMFSADSAIALDIHSGFGVKDRLWYPYAKSLQPFPLKREVMTLAGMLDRSRPNHIYTVEAQSLNYTTHGDLWDYLFDLHWEEHGKSQKKLFLPLTLEMGSWIWLKKNPWQLFSALGPFNPIKEHRFKRTMRRHKPLIDFLFKAVRHSTAWRQ